MTVTTIGTPEQYVANGVTTIFDYHSRVLLTTDIVVFVNNIQQFSGYTTVLLGGGNSGARVTFAAPPANGLVVELSNEPPATQEIDYTENTAFPANVQEFGLDKLTLLLQGIRNIVNRGLRRALRVPIYESSINELPSASARAGKYLSFDLNGQPLVGDLDIGALGNSVVSSIAALRALLPPIDGTMVHVLSYYGTGSRFGGGTFRYNGLSTVADNRGTCIRPNSLPAAGRWERMYDGDLYNTWFGTVGDGVTDDTVAWQACIDAGTEPTNDGGARRIIGVKGNYLVGPLFLNGSAWVASGKPIATENPAVRGLIGEGMMPFGCRFVAKAGAYPNPTDAILTGWNLAGHHIEGISLDGVGVAATLMDLRWFPAATSNGNVVRNIFGANAAAGNAAIILSGNMDSINSNIRYSGGSTAVGIRATGSTAGGGIWFDNLFVSKGTMEITCQNASFLACGFYQGVHIVEASFQDIVFIAPQIYANPTTGYCIYADTTPGSFVDSVTIISGLLQGITGTHYFAGRWGTGASLVGCRFVANKPIFDSANWAVNGVGNEPTFSFLNCFFNAAIPASIAGKVRVSTQALSNNGVVNERVVHDFSQDGPDGRYATGQGVAVIPPSTYFGTGYNRSALSAEVEHLYRSNLLRFTEWDGVTASIRLTMNTDVGEGLYPTPTNTWKLGRAGNLWTEVFATNATINTSDADMKSAMTTLSPKELSIGAAMLDGIITYKWNDAIEAKGKDKARKHVGLVAQDVKAIFADNGMQAEQYGIYCYDEWEADAEREAGKRHALRTEEALLLMLAALNARVKKLEG